MNRTANKIAFGVLWGVFWCFAKLPYPIQFLHSNVLCFMLYRVVRYRLGVVRTNLKKSFPDHSPAELQSIERKFYKHLADVFVETISIIGVTKAQFMRRMDFTNWAEYERQMHGRTSLLAYAHFGTWEYQSNFALFSNRDVLPVYRPLHSGLMDRIFYSLRVRFGVKPVAMEDVAKSILTKRRDKIPTVFAFVADQTPPFHQIKHWIPFLNQETAFFMGVEKLSLKYKLPVHFLYLRQTRRGFYEGTFEMIYDGVEPVDELEITRRYAQRLEAMILETPHLWMWSHKRWKHDKQRWESNKTN